MTKQRLTIGIGAACFLIYGGMLHAADDNLTTLRNLKTPVLLLQSDSSHDGQVRTIDMVDASSRTLHFYLDGRVQTSTSTTGSTQSQAQVVVGTSTLAIDGPDERKLLDALEKWKAGGEPFAISSVSSKPMDAAMKRQRDNVEVVIATLESRHSQGMDASGTAAVPPPPPAVILIDSVTMTPSIPVTGQPAALFVKFTNNSSTDVVKLSFAVHMDPEVPLDIEKQNCDQGLEASGHCGVVYSTQFTKVGHYRVRVLIDPKIQIPGGHVEDNRKDLEFDVVPPPPADAKIDILSPQGGESWKRGTEIQIHWNTNAPKLGWWLYRNGKPIQKLVDDVLGPTGSWDWTIPYSLPVGGGYTFNAFVYTPDGRAAQASQESLPFNIELGPGLKVVLPRHTTQWTAGQLHTVPIVWEGKCEQTDVQVDLYQKEEFIATLVRRAAFPPKLDCAAGATRTFFVRATPPPDFLVPSKDYHVHLATQDGAFVGDSSAFTIRKPENGYVPPTKSARQNAAGKLRIRILHPAAGERWQAGQPDRPTLEFQCPCRHSNVRVELWKGMDQVSVLREAGEHHGNCENKSVETYTRTVSAPSTGMPPGTDYFIRIISGDGMAHGDSAPFTIMPPARIGGIQLSGTD